MLKHILILFTCVLIISCNKGNLKYDFSKIESQTEINDLVKKIHLENKEIDIDTSSNFIINRINIKGMHYAGIPIKNVTIIKGKFKFATDSINYAGKKLLEAIEAKKGIARYIRNWNNSPLLEWETQTEITTLSLALINGKNLADLGDKDVGVMEITFKDNSNYTIPLANIHEKIQTFNKEPNYELDIEYFSNCKYDIIVNDVIIAENSTQKNFTLNYYITEETTSIKIIVKPKLNTESIPNKGFDENALFKASFSDVSNRQIIKTIEKTPLVGQNPIEFSLEVSSPLPWYPEAWTNGVDLQNDKDLDQKIKALYTKIGNALISKDEEALNDIFYQHHYELQQLYYETDYDIANYRWKELIEIQANSYKFTVATIFKIEYNANGKLIYVYPKNKTNMLTFTGKDYNHVMDYFLYQPKGSNELKIIR